MSSDAVDSFGQSYSVTIPTTSPLSPALPAKRVRVRKSVVNRFTHLSHLDYRLVPEARDVRGPLGSSAAPLRGLLDLIWQVSAVLSCEHRVPNALQGVLREGLSLADTQNEPNGWILAFVRPVCSGIVQVSDLLGNVEMLLAGTTNTVNIRCPLPKI